MICSRRCNGVSGMRILALEFSSALRSAAIIQEGQVTGRAQEEKPLTIGPIRLIRDVLGQAQMEPAGVTCVAVGLGPGSYTGVRVAIAMAQGWELARGVKLLGMSSVECLAWQAWLEGHEGDVAVVVDAQRGECYVARYRVTQQTLAAVEPLKLETRAEVERLEAGGCRLIGPDGGRLVPGLRTAFPEAGILGVLAWERGGFVPGADLQPIYLRAVDFVRASPPRVIPPRPPAGSRASPGEAPT